MNEEEEIKPEPIFDFDKMEKAQLREIHREGNYLVGVTDKGIRFRQRIVE